MPDEAVDMSLQLFNDKITEIKNFERRILERRLEGPAHDPRHFNLSSNEEKYKASLEASIRDLIAALGRINNPRAADYLIPLLYPYFDKTDFDNTTLTNRHVRIPESIRYASIDAIGQLGDERALGALKEELKDQRLISSYAKDSGVYDPSQVRQKISRINTAIKRIKTRMKNNN